jgi:hypothetical protein
VAKFQPKTSEAWLSIADTADVSKQELINFQKLNTAWQLAQLTGWTLDYIGSLSPKTIRHIFAIQEGVAEARKK